jgi:hypothetical protein
MNARGSQDSTSVHGSPFFPCFSSILHNTNRTSISETGVYSRREHIRSWSPGHEGKGRQATKHTSRTRICGITGDGQRECADCQEEQQRRQRQDRLGRLTPPPPPPPPPPPSSGLQPCPAALLAIPGDREHLHGLSNRSHRRLTLLD